MITRTLGDYQVEYESTYSHGEVQPKLRSHSYADALAHARWLMEAAPGRSVDIITISKSAVRLEGQADVDVELKGLAER